MANTQAICDTFKRDLFNGYFALGATTSARASTATVDAVKAAIYVTTATIGTATTAYSVTGEVTGTGYTAGGIACTNQAAGLTSSTAYWQPNNATLTWTTFTSSAAFDTLLFYKADAGTNPVANPSIASFTFGSQTVTAGNFTVNLPAYGNTTALIRLN